MKKIVITGGSGLVGSRIMRDFHDAGWHVVMASSTQNIRSLSDRLEIVHFDLRGDYDRNKLSAAIAGAAVVIHCGAFIPPPAARNNDALAGELVRTNVIGTMELALATAKAGVSQFVLISTTNMFGDAARIEETMLPRPQDYYAMSKYQSELAVQCVAAAKAMRCCTLRIRAPYGSADGGGSVISTFIDRAMRGGDLELWGSGGRMQTFTHVGDISRVCRQAIEASVQGVFNIAGPGPVTMKRLAEAAIAAAWPTKSKIVFNGKSDPEEGRSVIVDTLLAKQTFGYIPKYNIDAGMAEMAGLIRNPPPALYKNDE